MRTVASLKRIEPGAALSGAASRSTLEACFLTKIYYLAKPKRTDKYWETYEGEFSLEISSLKWKAQSRPSVRSYWTVYELPTLALAAQRHTFLFSPPRLFAAPGDLKTLSRLKYLPVTLGECCGVLREVFYDCDVFSAFTESVRVAKFPFLAYRMKTYYGNPRWHKERYTVHVAEMATAIAKVSRLLHSSL